MSVNVDNYRQFVTLGHRRGKLGFGSSRTLTFGHGQTRAIDSDNIMMQITNRGLQVLAENPPRVDTAYLKERSAEFREWIKAKPDAVTRKPDETATPEEIMESAYRERMDQVASDLLEKLQTSSPCFFAKNFLRAWLAAALRRPTTVRTKLWNRG